ncbi:nucleotide-binding protein [Rhodanobacter sp. DHG33]|uniref:TIR domain-containing protein n=1 Tax=Rhodanobacter sp. DHG33 TaxID=2775921 RepID=UPI00177E032A|nr:nucleotide-binding protein [Rhodanobacter sp. DHG33]MBD8899682.1 nucleotide-binding protein [Rhodanobacter sp. DHG33]
MKHKGTFEDLKTMVRAVGREITQSGPSGAMQQIKTSDGAVLSWYESTGTVQFQGARDAKQRLESDLCKYTGVAPALQTENSGSVAAAPASAPAASKVFIVHGHDSVAREQLELVIHKLGLDPYVLQNTGGGGLTIIEALEAEIGTRVNSAKFGIVLLTPDDVGYAKSAGDKEAQPRARQNVVLEMGMLISALGRKNVAILKKQHLEIPSDAQGILYIAFNDHVKEVVPKLVDRLRAAGFVLNPEAITRASS